MKTIRHSDSERGLQQEDQDGEEQPEDLREESEEREPREEGPADGRQVDGGREDVRVQ